MLNRIVLVVAVVFSGMFWGASTSFAEPDCLESSANPEICLKMRHMRSHLLLIEQQMLMMNADYDYYSATSASMDQLVTGLMRSMSANPHIDALEHLHMNLFQMNRQAQLGAVDTFVYANQLRTACSSCHEKIPVGTEGSDALFGMHWSDVMASCRTPGKNPYICQRMHTLAKNLQFFRTGEGLGLVDYKAAEQVAGEINRLALELAEVVAPVHPGGNHSLVKLAEEAEALRAMAASENPEAIFAGPKLIETCQQCHARIDR